MGWSRTYFLSVCLLYRSGFANPLAIDENGSFGWRRFHSEHCTWTVVRGGKSALWSVQTVPQAVLCYNRCKKTMRRLRRRETPALLRADSGSYPTKSVPRSWVFGG